MRVIIAGGRDYDDYHRLVEECDRQLGGWFSDEVTIFSGHAPGADTLGEEYAAEREYKVKQFPALWHKHGRGAGPIRNRQMVLKADVLIAFWDGKSKGTNGIIHEALHEGLEVHVYRYEPKEEK